MIMSGMIILSGCLSYIFLIGDLVGDLILDNILGKFKLLLSIIIENKKCLKKIKK